MQKYVKPSAGFKVVGIILIVAAVLVAALGILTGLGSESDAEPFYGWDDEGYCYLEIVGISDWIISDDTRYFYIAEDTEEYLYIVEMKESSRNKLTEQIEYWETDGESAQVVATIYGNAQKFENDVFEAIADTVEFTDQDMEDYFGNRYIREGSGGFADEAYGFLLLAAALAIIGAVMFIPSGKFNKIYKKSVANLQATGEYENALADFDMTSPTFPKDAIRFGSDFIFVKKLGLICKYTDVVWLYLFLNRTNGIPTTAALSLNGRFFKDTRVVIPVRQRDEIFEKTAETFRVNNPDVLLGFNLENNKTYKTLINQ